MNNAEFLSRLKTALKGQYDCLRGDDSSRVKIILQLGGDTMSDQCSSQITCKSGSVNLHIAVRNDTMQEVDLLYETSCVNSVLIFSDSKQSEHTAELYVIPHYGKKGPSPQTTLEKLTLECVQNPSRIQEIIKNSFLLDLNPSPNDEIITLTVTASIQ